MHWDIILTKELIGPFSDAKLYWNAQSEHSAQIFGGAKYIGGSSEHFVVHARRCPFTSKAWSLSFFKRTFWWSCHCLEILQAFGKQLGLAFLFTRLCCLCFFMCVCVCWWYMKNEVYRQMLKTIAQLKQYTSAVFESIPGVSLILISTNCVLSVRHVVTVNAEHTKNTVD